MPSRFRLAVPLLLLPLASVQGSAEPPAPLPPEALEAARAVRDAARAGSRATEWVRRLTDEVGPRLAGSPGDRAAVAWGVALMKELGFANVRAEPVTVKVWERGVETGEVVAPFHQRLVLTALGGSVPTPEGGLEGELVEVGSLEALDEAAKASPGRFDGKIVFFNRRTSRSDAMNGYGATVGIRGDGAARAAAHGAIGVLIRSIGTSTDRLAHTGAMRYAAGGRRIPAAAVSNPDADLLARLVARGSPVRVRFTLGCRERPDAESANVVGEVVGRERPGEVVVVGGHLDSWDLGTGAIDDGAGCAQALEAARLVAAAPRRPRRTVRVVLFANEENGLAGGRAYAEAHAAELPRHVAAIEADSGTGAPKGFGVNAGDGGLDLLAPLSTLLEPLGAGTLRKGGGGADISPMAAAGVPQIGLTVDTTTYFDYHHTANDTFDKIEPESLEKGAAALATLVYALADAPEPLPRLPVTAAGPKG